MNAELSTKSITAQSRLMQILLKPHMSEKATNLSEQHSQFVFKVVADATKPEIKQAIELLFEVKVESVRILNVKSKERRFKQKLGKRKGWKKAYIALKAGQDISFIESK